MIFDIKTTIMPQMTHYMKMEETDMKKTSGTAKSESLSDRDAGFCSGEETDLDTEYHSPTDTSRDSIDTKDVVSDTFASQNKRKSEQLSEHHCEHLPEAKIIKLENSPDRASPCSIRTEPVPYIKIEKSCSPFRPWSIDRPCSREYSPIPSGYVPPLLNYVQEEPLALVVNKKKPRDELDIPHRSHLSPVSTLYRPKVSTEQAQDLSVSIRAQQQQQQRIPHSEKFMLESLFGQTESTSNRCGPSSVIVSPRDRRKSSQCDMGTDSSGSSRGDSRSPVISSQQRNYKNMTRERRIEANARERTRVHTISAAFETLRSCIPAYANNQKLSKLSVLRIACSYIMTLSRIAGYDYSIDQSAPSLAECIDNVCNTIQLEGKTRKKKDE